MASAMLPCTPPPRALPCTIHDGPRPITPEPLRQFSYSEYDRISFSISNGLLPSVPLPKQKSPKLTPDSPLLQSNSAMARLAIFTLAAQSESDEEDTPPQTPLGDGFATPELSWSSPDSTVSSCSSPGLSSPPIGEAPALGLAFEDLALEADYEAKDFFRAIKDFDGCATTSVHVKAFYTSSPPVEATATPMSPVHTFTAHVHLKSQDALSTIKHDISSQLPVSPAASVSFFWQTDGGRLDADRPLPVDFHRSPFLLAAIHP